MHHSTFINVLQVVQSQLTTAPDSGALLADEALEGSGSGDRPLWGRRPGQDPDDADDEDDPDDDRDDGEASGSGMGPSVIGETFILFIILPCLRLNLHIWAFFLGNKLLRASCFHFDSNAPRSFFF